MKHDVEVLERAVTIAKPKINKVAIDLRQATAISVLEKAAEIAEAKQ